MLYRKHLATRSSGTSASSSAFPALLFSPQRLRFLTRGRGDEPQTDSGDGAELPYTQNDNDETDGADDAAKNEQGSLTIRFDTMLDADDDASGASPPRRDLDSLDSPDSFDLSRGSPRKGPSDESERPRSDSLTLLLPSLPFALSRGSPPRKELVSVPSCKSLLELSHHLAGDQLERRASGERCGSSAPFRLGDEYDSGQDDGSDELGGEPRAGICVSFDDEPLSIQSDQDQGSALLSAG